MKMSRRSFLQSALVAGAACAVPGRVPSAAARASVPPLEERRLIVVLCGGGTRSSESIGDSELRWVPRLWNDMVPRGTLFTNMRVEHKVVHPNSAGSVVTGHWEWDDIDWSRPVAHPTIYEIFRRKRSAPDTAAWAFVYASILANTGESTAPGYGRRFAANIVEPPTIPRSASDEAGCSRRQPANSSPVSMPAGSPEPEPPAMTPSSPNGRLPA